MEYSRDMYLVGLLSWWYGAGWRQRSVLVKGRLTTTLDYFSLGLLLKTFFSPFRQISAGKVNGSLETQFRAFIDRLISRAIGAMVRSAVLVVGVAFIIVHALWGALTLVFWLLIPLFPLIGIVVFFLGWTPR